MRTVFTEIYEKNAWKGNKSVSGNGSDLKQTAEVRRQLPPLLARLGVTSMLDVPCGDYYWMSQLDLEVQYIGADIVPALIEYDRARYADTDFRLLDVTKDDLPAVDLVLCRDLLGHFSNYDVQQALRNLRRSGAKYLLSTTFPGRSNDIDIKTGEWRPIDLGRGFGLPRPILVINEKCTQAGGQFADKSLGLWKLER